VDSSFASGWIGVSSGLLNERANALTAREALQRALRHPERLGPMQRRDAEASLALLEFDAASALQAYERMLLLDPGDLTALSGRASTLPTLGRYEEALADYRRLEELSPFGPTAGMLWNRMLILQRSGRLEEARALIPRIPGALGRSASADGCLLVGRLAASDPARTGGRIGWIGGAARAGDRHAWRECVPCRHGARGRGLRGPGPRG